MSDKATFELISDFVNTRDIELGKDALTSPGDLRGWLASHGLAPLHARTTTADLAEAGAVRESLRELLRANNGIGVDTDGAARVLERSAARARLALHFEPARLEPSVGGAGAGIGRIVAAAAEAMADPDWERLKACRADNCRWAFVDHAKNRSRAWCDMKVCGNREKAHRFRERHALS
jgi:predicted RNA-binding Zn ribbon-like protein